MLNVVLFGPPGAGKGTQSEILLQRYGLIHLSTGDIFRANIKGQTELGQQAKAFMDKGELVPDSLTISMLESEVVKHPQAKGFIFDGFPRTSAQAEALDAFLNNRSTAITCMLALEVNEEELIKRLLNRATTSGRADDADETIVRNRIAVYNRETSPVADFYRVQNKYRGVLGVGSVEEITARLCAELDAFLEA
jgi:adenylate kinase